MPRSEYARLSGANWVGRSRGGVRRLARRLRRIGQGLGVFGCYRVEVRSQHCSKKAILLLMDAAVGVVWYCGVRGPMREYRIGKLAARRGLVTLAVVVNMMPYLDVL
jgi:hypothetical protein